MVTIGAEGFYGQSTPERQQENPNGALYGVDFLANNQVQEIDFATIHAYPDKWYVFTVPLTLSLMQRGYTFPL